MQITDYSENGKVYATVTEGEAIVYRTPDYYTARMAVADAVAWVAFHGPAGAMGFGLQRAYMQGLAARERMEAEATVTVSTGTHCLPLDLALELIEPAPTLRTVSPGTMGARMLARQQAFRKAAELLGISPAEAKQLPRLLRANKR